MHSFPWYPCFAGCIEGLFFFGAFAYEVLRTVRHEEPELFDSQWAAEVRTMIEEEDVQELTNFFERKVSAYQVAVQGDVAFDHAF